MNDQLNFLQTTLHSEIPLTRQMGIRVADYSGSELFVHADLAPNINIHGTAFGGSLYSICAAACWGLLHLKLMEQQVAAQIVLAEGEIKYRRPVREDILVRCSLPDSESCDRFIYRARQGRKAAITLDAEIMAGNRQAVVFKGHFSSVG
jgi:thioesterase domain-containing protein